MAEAEGKFNLPDDLLSSQLSDRSFSGKVEVAGGHFEDKLLMGSHDDPKDQGASENIIPLSPQWLYSKPSDTKMETRTPSVVSLGNAADPNHKENWRLDVPDDKKDWRKVAADNEASRRWREEERETGLLGPRRDRRKVERRVENAPNKEANDTRTTAASDRWSDGNTRNTVFEARRDSKWSSRWGPDDKEKESRGEKKTEMEKEDSQIENKSALAGNKAAPERDSESRDKWRPRHRMEVHPSSSSPFRAAPGFGNEKGRLEGSPMGFTVGRGRGGSIGRSSAPIGAILSDKHGIPGKPAVGTESFCYPRAKLLDIYRMQKFGLSFATMPDGMVELAPITQVGVVDPLAFVSPDTEEEVVLGDIWRGRISSSGAVYNSSRRSSEIERLEGSFDAEFSEGKQTNLPLVQTEEYIDSFLESSTADACRPDGNEITPGSEEVKTAVVSDFRNFNSDDTQGFDDITGLQFSNRKLTVDDNVTITESALANHRLFGGSEPASFGDSVSSVLAEDTSLLYLDPQGEIQGPFLGVDILSWFEQGFFGTDLPVRIADTPDGTPFRELGELFPHLIVTNEFVRSVDSTLQESGSVGGFLDLPASAQSMINDDISNVNGLSHPQSDVNSLSVPQQLLHQDGNFHDFAAQDEEIVFLGRPGSSGHPYERSGNEVPLHSMNQRFQNEPEPGMQTRNDKLHPFGLLWSELENSRTNHTQASKLPLRGGSNQFSAPANPSVEESWPDNMRRNSLSDQVKLYHDSMAPQQFPHISQEPNHFDLPEHNLSRQFQHQLQQNMLSSRTQLGRSNLEHVPIENHALQQHPLPNHPVTDIERLMAQQLQQQRQHQLQRQLQQQHQLQQQQQQQQQLQQQLLQRQQQKLLQEQQQSQVHQVLMERMLQSRMHDTAMNQVLLDQQLLHDMQQRNHLPPRNVDPSIEQLIQAKFGRVPQHELHRELLLSQAQQGQMQSLEHQILQEQLQARQFSMGLGVQNGIEDERRLGTVWRGEESGQFLRNYSNNRAHASGLNHPDFYQQQSGPSREDPMSFFDRNSSLQERLRHGFYESGVLPFERSHSFPAGDPNLNLDMANNAMARIHGFDMQEPSTRGKSGAQVGTFPSELHPQFHVPRPDTVENYWSDNKGQPPNDWLESRMQQLNINAGLQKRDAEAKMTVDHIAWMSDAQNDNKSKQLLMELLHQKSKDQIYVSDETERKPPTGLYPGAITVDRSANHIQDSEATLNSSFTVGSYGSNLSDPPNIFLGDEQKTGLGNRDRMPFGAESGGFLRGEQFSSGTGESASGAYRNPDVTSQMPLGRDFMGMESWGDALEIPKGSIKPPAGLVARGHDEVPASAFSRIPSVGISGDDAGFYDDVSRSNYTEQFAKERVPVILSKGQDNMMHRVSSVQQHTASEVGRDPTLRRKGSFGGVSEGIRANQDGNPTNPPQNHHHQQDAVAAATRSKDTRFRRTGSYSDSDVSETSFIDMLKNSKKADVMAGQEASDGDSRGGKKKGKKGRQLDPALLGFKVASNRIMGEIHGIDD